MRFWTRATFGLEEFFAAKSSIVYQTRLLTEPGRRVGDDKIIHFKLCLVLLFRRYRPGACAGQNLRTGLSIRHHNRRRQVSSAAATAARRHDLPRRCAVEALLAA